MTLARAALSLSCAALIACATGRPRSPSAVDGSGGAPKQAPAQLPAVADTDGDGLVGDGDVCPNDPEDRDGFRDEDGCPDLDNDHDRILDALDKCPDEPETYNLISDDDGCPDRPPPIARPERHPVNIAFARGRAVIPPASLADVDLMAHWINDNPCRVVELQGHTSDDERGPEALGTARAEAVRAALAARGVRSEQLKVRSLGAAQPLCRDATEPCRARNRRTTPILLDLLICK